MNFVLYLRKKIETTKKQIPCLQKKFTLNAGQH